MIALLLDLLELAKLESSVLHMESARLAIISTAAGRTSCTGICMYKHPFMTFASSKVLTLETLRQVKGLSMSQSRVGLTMPDAAAAQ